MGAAITRGISLVAVALSFCMPGRQAAAQSLPNPLPTTATIDRNGVDLINWSFSYEITSISLGPTGQPTATLSIMWPSDRDSYYADLRVEDPSQQSTTRMTATTGGRTWVFLGGGSVEELGTYIAGPMYDAQGRYVYTVYARDGTTIDYEDPGTLGNTGPITLCAILMTRPDGEVLTYHNKYTSIPCRTQSVVSNRGYQVKYEYTTTTGTQRSRITLINNAHEYCAPAADSCSLSMSWPYISFAYSPYRTFTNHLGQAWTINNGIVPPSQSTPVISWTTEQYIPPHAAGNYTWRVTSATRDGGTWLYTYPSSDPYLGGTTEQLMRVQDPLGNVTRFRRSGAYSSGDPTEGEIAFPNLLVSSTDPFNNVTTYGYTSDAGSGLGSLPTAINLPEGMGHLATYDSQGNVLTYTRRPRTGSGAANLTTTYTYGTLNDRPLTVTDPNGNVTDYTYDSTHRGVLTETRPAPTSGAPRPVTRYAYSQRYAWVRNSSGSSVQADSPIWVLDTERKCRTSATVGGTCAGGSSDEVTVTYDYGPNSGPNNLWLRGRVETADGVSRRTCYTYDATGNRISETQPNAGLTSCP